MVRQLAAQLSPSHCFTFRNPTITRAEVRRLIQISAARDDPRRLVLVIDDVSRLSAQKLAWLRELTRNGVQIIVVVERRAAGGRAVLPDGATGSATEPRLVAVSPMTNVQAERRM